MVMVPRVWVQDACLLGPMDERCLQLEVNIRERVRTYFKFQRVLKDYEVFILIVLKCVYKAQISFQK